MKLMERLTSETTEDREFLLTSPIIQQCLAGDITLHDYVAFLSQAYHHVKHTVPLLMATGARLPEEKEWLREAVAEYIEEELGHQEWILNDIAACGFDKEKLRRSEPSPATELMVAYAYHTIDRGNPVGFLGMVLVLEGTSVRVATEAAQKLQTSLGLPKQAFSYLTSHGSLDVSHMDFYRNLVNRLESTEDQEAVIHCAKRFYRLYGDVFRELPLTLDDASDAA